MLSFIQNRKRTLFFILSILVGITIYYLYSNQYFNHHSVRMQDIATPPRTTDFIDFDKNLSTPDLNVKYIKVGKLKDLNYILPTEKNNEHLICQDITTKDTGVWNQNTGCMTSKGRTFNYGLIDSNYQYSWVPTPSKYPLFNACGVDVICLRPITPELQNVNQFVYNDGYIRPIGSTSLCVATDKETMRFIFLAACSDSNVFNRWDCNVGNTEIKLRADLTRRIAYEKSNNQSFSRVFLTDQDENVNTSWVWDNANNLFKVNDYAMSIYKVIGSVKKINNTDVCQIASEYNNLTNMWSNISYLQREFTQSALFQSALINPYKGQDIIDGAVDKYTDKTYLKKILDNGTWIFVSNNGFLQIDENTNTLTFNRICSEQYRWVFRIEVVKYGDKFNAHSIKIHAISVGRNPPLQGLLTYNSNKTGFIVDFQKNRRDDEYIFYAKSGTRSFNFLRPIYNTEITWDNSVNGLRLQNIPNLWSRNYWNFYIQFPTLYPKLFRNISIPFPEFSCSASAGGAPDYYFFKYDAYINCMDCWSYQVPRTFPSINTNDLNIPYYYIIPIYMYKGRYLKAFETQDHVPVAFQNGSLVYSPQQTDPWGLYALPLQGLSDVSNWGYSEPPYTRHAAIQDNTNNCLWVITSETSSTYFLQTAYIETISGSSQNDIRAMLNARYDVFKVPYNQVFRSQDQNLWISRFQNNSAIMTMFDKIIKEYRPKIIQNGIEIVDPSKPSQPYLFRRIAVINYNNTRTELPLGMRYQSIGIYNDTNLWNTRYRDDYNFKNPIIPTIEDLSFIIKNELLKRSINATSEALELLAIRWFPFMDKEYERYNLNTINTWLNGIYNNNGRKNYWTIYEVLSQTYDPDILLGYRN